MLDLVQLPIVQQSKRDLVAKEESISRGPSSQLLLIRSKLERPLGEFLRHFHPVNLLRSHKLEWHFKCLSLLYEGEDPQSSHSFGVGYTLPRNQSFFVLTSPSSSPKKRPTDLFQFVKAGTSKGKQHKMVSGNCSKHMLEKDCTASQGEALEGPMVDRFLSLCTMNSDSREGLLLYPIEPAIKQPRYSIGSHQPQSSTPSNEASLCSHPTISKEG